MSAVRERRTAPMNGAARIAFVLCVASALSRAVEAATTTYVGNCDDIASHTGSSSQTVQAFDFLQCCSSSLAKGFSYSLRAIPGTIYTAKVVKSSSDSGTMFNGQSGLSGYRCEVYNGGCFGGGCRIGYYQCSDVRCCWEDSADNWCLNVECLNNDGTACVFSDFTITFDAHTVSCTAGTDYGENRGEYLDGGSCQSCPANSKGAGGSATTCTCADGYYATKYTTTVDTCTACPAGSSKTGSTIFGDSAAETTSVCVANCASNQYWDGQACATCPAGAVRAVDGTMCATIWYSTADLSDVLTGSQGEVTGWTDATGNGYDIGAGAGSSAPTLETSTDGKYAVRMGGSSRKYLRSSDYFAALGLAEIPQPFTVMAVIKINSGSAYLMDGYLMDKFAIGIDNGDDIYPYPTTNLAWRGTGGASLTGNCGFPSAGWGVHEWVFSNTAGETAIYKARRASTTPRTP